MSGDLNLLPEQGVSQYIARFAAAHQVDFERSRLDDWAEAITRAPLLEETLLVSDQLLELIARGTRRLRVTVRDTWGLRWWLMGRAGQIEVLTPA